MKFDLKAVYNPLKEDFVFTHDSADFVIPAKGIKVFPEFLIEFTVKALVNKILWDSGKEIDDISRPELVKEVLSHDFVITDTSEKKTKVKEEKTKEE